MRNLPKNQHHLQRYALRELEIAISNRGKLDRLQIVVEALPRQIHLQCAV